MRLLPTANKNEPLKVLFQGFRKYYSDINSKNFNDSSILSFPLVFLWFSYFKISKAQARSILNVWENEGLIQLKPFHGVLIPCLKFGVEGR